MNTPLFGRYGALRAEADGGDGAGGSSVLDIIVQSLQPDKPPAADPKVAAAPAPAPAAGDKKIDPPAAKPADKKEAAPVAKPVKPEPVGRAKPDPNYMRGLTEYMTDGAPPVEAPKLDKDGKPIPPAKPAEVVVDPKAAAAPPVDDGKPKSRVKLTRTARAADPVVKPPAATPPAAAKPAAAADAELLDEERDDLEVAEFAARTDPRHRELPKTLRAYFKAHADYIKAAQAKNPDVLFDAENAEYQAFVKSRRPGWFTAREERKLRDGMIEERVTQRFDTRLNTDNTKREKLPEIKQRGDQFFDEALATDALPKEVAEAITRDGLEAASKSFGLEIQAYRQAASEAAEEVEALLGFADKVVTYDPKDPVHKNLLQFINRTCADFAANGGAHRVRNGKNFVTREAMANLDAAQAAQVWTFSNDELIKVKRYAVRVVATARIDAEKQRRAAEGWTRAEVAAAAAAPVVDDDGAPPPAAHGRGAPAASDTPADEAASMPTAMRMLYGETGTGRAKR